LNNTVELLGYYGSDEVIACSAWTSTSRDLSKEKIDRIPKLINMLWSEGHQTPFEKGVVHFLVDTDIATHIQICKHRISNLNAECLDGDTLITFENINGSAIKKKIKDLYRCWQYGRTHQLSQKDAEYSKKRIKKMRLRVMNEYTGKLETSSIKDIWKSGEKEVYRITLRNGKSIVCSDNHPIFTKSSSYKSINDGLSLGDLVACNGISTEIEGKPWSFHEFFNGSEDFTRKEFAKKKKIKYELCKKWGYIFNVTFKEDENKDFKKGNIPWNAGKAGTYSLNISEEGLCGRSKSIKRGKDSNFWRGGLSSERAKIGAWTTNNAPYIHHKYNYTCQKCGENKSDLHAHHIIPVCQDESKSYDLKNLITVCRKCHSEIHKSLESEMEFAKQVSHSEVVFEYDKRLNRKVGSSKIVYYSDIISIEHLGKRECYDIEVEGDFKNFIANGIVTHNSARYKELKEDKYLLPEDWSDIAINRNFKLPTSFGEVVRDEGIVPDWLNVLEWYTKLGNKLYHQCIEDLTPVLGRKRAKESARFFKTYNSQIQGDLMFNMRSFSNFLKLRNSEQAQKEIRDLSQKMLELVKGIDGNPFKHTLESFGY
jgi:thymidylate synthase (FAD)